MPRVTSGSFTADLIEEALKLAGDACTVVFPTEISAALARKRFMVGWQLQDCDFLSMKELKRNLLLPQIPAVSDDKRMLCLYQSLSEEDRLHFHINGYFDVVEWGNQFFQFFEELCDENVEAAKLQTPYESFGINLLSWQEEYLQKVLAIRARYCEHLDRLGLTDPIMFMRASLIRVPFSGRRIVFVNQYYYSNLEKQLIKALEKEGNEVVVISQAGANSSSNLEPLGTPEICLEGLKPTDIRTTGIQVIECENAEQMILAFLARHSPAVEDFSDSRVIVDGKFNQKHYRHLFDPTQYKSVRSGSFIQSGIHAFLQILNSHLIALNSTLDSGYIPLRTLLAACTQDGFIRYYQPDWSIHDKDLLLNELKFLLDQDILYIDKGLELFKLLQDKREYSYLPRLLMPHFALLDKLSQIHSPTELIALIDAPGGLIIRKMSSLQELQHSNALEQFYERLANFASLDKQGLVPSWGELFAADGINLSASIMRLFLESLASARLGYKTSAEGGSPAYDVSNLLDLRNLSYDTVVFFHANEGEYPSNPASVWLFNENQRQRLGLKSYEELRKRERYYFHRQVLTSRQALIYCYRSQEHDIEPGSYVTELIHASENNSLAGLDRIVPQIIQPRISHLYQARALRYGTDRDLELEQQDAGRIGLDRANPNDFFVLPASPEVDFDPEHSLKASYQSLRQLDENPFAWYIRELRKIKSMEPRPEETISRKLFGSLLHGFLARVLNPLRGPHLEVGELASILDSEQVLAENLSQLISSSIYLYKLPQNYNHEFLASVISGCLVSSVREFYRQFLIPRLNGTCFELQPEEDRMTKFEAQHKTLASHTLAEIEYQLRIRGIADLRIECPAKNLIVDFKTGTHKAAQLMFYEYFYYLLNDDYDGRDLESTFWMILEQTPKEKTDQAKRERWRDKMRRNLEVCLTFGYGQGKTSTYRKTIRNITRADLYHPPTGGEA